MKGEQFPHKEINTLEGRILKMAQERWAGDVFEAGLKSEDIKRWEETMDKEQLERIDREWDDMVEQERLDVLQKILETLRGKSRKETEKKT